MTVNLRDLINLNRAAKQLGLDPNDLLFDALEGKLHLYALATEERSISIIPCRRQWIEEERIFIDSYKRDDAIEIGLEVGQPLALNSAAVKGLIVNQKFSEVELYRHLGPDLTDDEFHYWRTSEELFEYNKFVDGKLNYPNLGIEVIYAVKAETNPNRKKLISNRKEHASNTSLKVIGLFMHHLAKSPKYASGTTPNKSQIKELLLDLATELGVNPYGLSKVDERLLTDALKYLEEQKL